MGLTGLRSGSGKKELSKSFKRKLEKKLSFYSKVKEAAVSLGAKKAISKKKRLRSRQKKLKAYDLSALSELLPDVQPCSATNLKLNCKSRRKLVQRESAQLRAVLRHPTFVTNPLAAIHQHIENTQPPSVENKKKQSNKRKKKAKRKGVKPASSLQAMDI